MCAVLEQSAYGNPINQESCAGEEYDLVKKAASRFNMQAQKAYCDF